MSDRAQKLEVLFQKAMLAAASSSGYDWKSMSAKGLTYIISDLRWQGWQPQSVA